MMVNTRGSTATDRLEGGPSNRRERVETSATGRRMPPVVRNTRVDETPELNQGFAEAEPRMTIAEEIGKALEKAIPYIVTQVVEHLKDHTGEAVRQEVIAMLAERGERVNP